MKLIKAVRGTKDIIEGTASKYSYKVKKYYEPGNNKFENQIREKIEKLWKNRK